MTTIVFLLEEPSAREMLQGILYRLCEQLNLDADDFVFKFQVFDGKQDLEKNLVPRMRGWQLANTRFIVLRDQDSADCRQVLLNLRNLCAQAGRPDALVRIVCRELESWYLGDLKAVEEGLSIPRLSLLQLKKKFRNPDVLQNAKEELKKLTQYSYQQIDGSRRIAPYLKLQGNLSPSYKKLIEGLTRILTAPVTQ